MHHYDLYSALGLDRSASCADLAAQIDQRSAAGPTSQASELRAARAVLGSPERRAIYDRQLADPTSPPITLQAITELAEMDLDGPDETRAQPAPMAAPVGPASPAAWSAAAAAPAPAPGPTGGSGNTTRNILIGAGAVVVVAAVTIGGILLTRDSGDEGDHNRAANFTESNGTTQLAPTSAPENTPTPSPGQSPARESAPARDSQPSVDSVGLSGRGWESSPGDYATCNVTEDSWVYAAYNSRGEVVICQSESTHDYYYRGIFGGNPTTDGFEGDVDMGSADTDRGRYYVDASPATITINGDRLTVRDSSGSTTKTESFDHYWTSSPAY